MTTATSANVQRDRRLRLVDGDLDGAHPRVGAAPRRRSRPATVSIRSRGSPADDRRPRARPARRSGRCRRGRRTPRPAAEVQPDRDVDDEVLPVAPLVVEHAVVAADPQPAQRDPVAHGAPVARVRARRRRRACSHGGDRATASTRGGARRAPAPPTPRPRGQRGDRGGRASSRPSGGRSVPSASASSAPRNRLRDAPTSTGNPSADAARPAVRSSAQLCFGGLGEAQPRVEHEHAPGRRRPRPRRRPGPRSSARTSATTSSYAASASMSALWPRQCMRTHGHPGRGDDRGHLRVGQPAGHVVDHAAPASSAASATAARVVSMLTAHARRRRARAITGSTRRVSVVGVDPVRAGPGRLAADVDEVGARRRAARGRARRRVAVEVAAAVGERVRRDVQHAHHQRTGRAGQPARQHHRARGSGSSPRRACVGAIWKIPRTAEVVVARPGLADAAHRHAQVLGLDHDDHPARLELAHQRVGDLGGQPLLHLRAPGVDVDQPGQLGQAGDPAVAPGM